MRQKSKLEEAFDRLKTEVLSAGIRWVEPTLVPLFDHPDERYLWPSDEKQRHGFALSCGHDNAVRSDIITVKMIGFLETNHFTNYKTYLRLNGWL
jgi:hypothetical protein